MPILQLHLLKPILLSPPHNSTYLRNYGTRHHPPANLQCKNYGNLSAYMERRKQISVTTPWLGCFDHWRATFLVQTTMIQSRLNTHITWTLTLTAQCLPQIILLLPLIDSRHKLSLLTNTETSSDSVDHRANFHFNMKKRRQLNRPLHHILHTTSRLHIALMVRHLSKTNPGLARVLS